MPQHALSAGDRGRAAQQPKRLLLLLLGVGVGRAASPSSAVSEPLSDSAFSPFQVLPHWAVLTIKRGACSDAKGEIAVGRHVGGDLGPTQDPSVLFCNGKTEQPFNLGGSTGGPRAVPALQPQKETSEGKPVSSAHFYVSPEPRPCLCQIQGSYAEDLGVYPPPLLLCLHLLSLSLPLALSYTPIPTHTITRILQAQKDLCIVPPQTLPPTEILSPAGGSGPACWSLQCFSCMWISFPYRGLPFGFQERTGQLHTPASLHSCVCLFIQTVGVSAHVLFQVRGNSSKESCSQRACILVRREIINDQ